MWNMHQFQMFTANGKGLNVKTLNSPLDAHFRGTCKNP